MSYSEEEEEDVDVLDSEEDDCVVFASVVELVFASVCVALDEVEVSAAFPAFSLSSTGGARLKT